MTLELRFSGWFQCRLPTDPDPCDEPRGVSGTTFALCGEPDLDRIIRFHAPVAPRTPGPAVGVDVGTVLIDDREAPDHALLGAPFALLDDPVFDGRNGLVAEDGREPIVPLHVSVSRGGVALAREDPLDGRRTLVVERDGERLVSTARAYVRRRMGGGVEGGPDAEREMLDAAGIESRDAHARERLGALEAALAAAGDELARAALKRRIADFATAKPGSRRPGLVPIRVWYRHLLGELGGPPPRVDDDNGALGFTPDPREPWRLEMWMGLWDADALCAFVAGSLTIPRAAVGAPGLAGG